MDPKKTVWGLDVGASALKAVRLAESEGQVRLEAFERIEHARPADRGGLAAREAMLASLRQFRGARDLSGCHVVAGLPAGTGWLRTLHLPPLDHADVPEVVRFEAAQQAPWPLEEAMWRWQTFRDPNRPDAPDVEAGIFVVPKSRVGDCLLLMGEAGIALDGIQMAPAALFNFAAHEGHLEEMGPVVIADVGAFGTVLVIGEPRRLWARSVPAGGDLAGQVRQAVDEFSAMRGSARPARLLLAGGGAGAPDLADRLAKELGIPVAHLEGLRRIVVGGTEDAPTVGAATAELAVACGLALQGLARAAVNVDFLPRGIAAKTDWFHPTWRERIEQWVRGLSAGHTGPD